MPTLGKQTVTKNLPFEESTECWQKRKANYPGALSVTNELGITQFLMCESQLQQYKLFTAATYNPRSHALPLATWQPLNHGPYYPDSYANNLPCRH